MVKRIITEIKSLYLLAGGSDPGAGCRRASQKVTLRNKSEGDSNPLTWHCKEEVVPSLALRMANE